MNKLKVENVGVFPYRILAAHTWIDKSGVKHSLTLLDDYNGHAYNKIFDDKLKHATKLGVKNEFEEEKRGFVFPDGFIPNAYFVLLIDGRNYYLVNRDDLYQMYLKRKEAEEPFYNLMIQSIFNESYYFKVVRNYCNYLNDYIMQVWCKKYIINAFGYIVLNPYYGMNSEQLLKVEDVHELTSEWSKHIDESSFDYYGDEERERRYGTLKRRENDEEYMH